MKELPNLSAAERRLLFEKLQELAISDAGGQLREEPLTIDLASRGISAEQAASLRSRLATFSDDWDRPEAAIYDEDQAR